MNPPSPSHTEKRKSITTKHVDPIPSPNRLTERPPKFWLKPHHNRDLKASASAPLTSFSSAVEHVDEGRSCHHDSVQNVEKQGKTVSDDVVGENKDSVAASGKTMGNLELADDSSVMKNDRGSDGENNDGADDKNGDEISAGPKKEGRSRRSTTMSAKSAAADLLRGRNVLDWTAADVVTWIQGLPRGLGAFAEAEAFAKGRVDGKRLAKLTLSDIKRKEFRHAKFKAKVRVGM